MVTQQMKIMEINYLCTYDVLMVLLMTVDDTMNAPSK